MRRPSANPGPRYAERLVRLALSNEALNTKGPAMRPIAAAIRCTCSSLSITHGPAIRANGDPPPNRISGVTSIGSGVLHIAQKRTGHAPLAILVGGRDKGPEQRMRLERLGFELGMELATQIPRVIGKLADLH